MANETKSLTLKIKNDVARLRNEIEFAAPAENEAEVFGVSPLALKAAGAASSAEGNNHG